jgi:hypothetical protein
MMLTGLPGTSTVFGDRGVDDPARVPTQGRFAGYVLGDRQVADWLELLIGLPGCFGDRQVADWLESLTESY